MMGPRGGETLCQPSLWSWWDLAPGAVSTVTCCLS